MNPKWNDLVEERFKIFPVYIQMNEELSRTSLHYQPGIEIHLTLEGKAMFISDGRVLPQQPLDVLIHRGSNPHQLNARQGKPYRRMILCIDHHRLKQAEAGELIELLHFDWIAEDLPVHMRLDGKSYTRLLDFCGRIRDELHTKQDGWRELIMAHLLEAVVLLKRKYRITGTPEDGNQGISQLVRQCVEYTYLHLDGELSLGFMANRFSISKEHLARSFKKEMGVSFHQFVISARIENSGKLLRNFPELSISDIALQVGFSSLSRFSHSFKNLMGESPREYRERFQKPNIMT